MSSSPLGSDLKIIDEELGSDLALSPNGDLEIVKEEYNLGQAIINRLRTRLGELADLGHPNYGSRLYELVGEPNNERTRELAKAYVRESVMRDPRVKEIINISVRPNKDDGRRVDIDITVLPIGKSTALNIVFPFYLEVV
ncbi:GPW/gp25 family protein [Candidatus Bathyarchaeota archaeon]|nr:GPW/gp25 family protein [Candidatus Bathyarchaeota archaeon]MBS7634394.1 GPW/gp25 family protein [Candidatus Bathyarchaeota archaeon]